MLCLAQKSAMPFSGRRSSSEYWTCCEQEGWAEGRGIVGETAGRGRRPPGQQRVLDLRWVRGMAAVGGDQLLSSGRRPPGQQRVRDLRRGERQGRRGGTRVAAERPDGSAPAVQAPARERAWLLAIVTPASTNSCSRATSKLVAPTCRILPRFCSGSSSGT